MEILNCFYYLWKRNNWMLDIRNYLKNYSNKIKIGSPIFLLGNQGDGLTLLSRMLRRNPLVVSATGNYKYWTGADELQNVFELILPRELSGIRLKAPKHNFLSPPRSWSYACDDLIPKYRNTENDATEYFRKKLKQVIGIVLLKHGNCIKNPRFVDKSQVFTVKMSFIYKLLEDCNPYFIFVTRNPYVSCYRAAIGRAGDMRRYAKFMTLDERIKICIEHWYNSVRSIEEDRNKVKNFLHVRFEDLLKYPEEILKRICDFIEIEFLEDMLPHKEHKIPFGTRFRERWYPLKPSINEQYINRIPRKYIELIYKKCEKYATLYGYNKH